MRGLGNFARTFWHAGAVLTLLGLGACTVQPPAPEPVPPEPVEAIVIPEPVEPPPPQPKPVVAQSPGSPPLAIVLTSSQPAYLDVAAELAAYFDDHRVYDLSAESLPPVAVLRSINDSRATAVVAIGLQAALSAVALADVPVVFCQVFNHQDYDLLNARSRGVSALAPPEAQLAAWKKLNPELKRIGLIIGAGHDALIADATTAAGRHGIELQVQVAHSDQETLYLFRRLIRDIDGFWLLPDNRILSTRVLQQMLDEARRHGIEFAVPSDAMLPMGATVSFSSVAADIAAKVNSILAQVQAGRIASVPPMSELTEVRVLRND